MSGPKETLVMGFEYFSNDPREGISFHEHEDDARGEAEATLDQLNDDAADSAFGWEDLRADEVCWGIVCGRAERAGSRPASDEERAKGFETIESWAVRDYDQEPNARIAELEKRCEGLREHPVLRFVIGEEGPGPVAGRFIEVTDGAGKSVDAGAWTVEPDGTWALTVPSPLGEFEEARRERAAREAVEADLAAARAENEEREMECARLRTVIGDLKGAPTRIRHRMEKAESDLAAVRAENERLREWQDGVRGGLLISHPPRTNGHTEEAFVAHQFRYLDSAARNTPYAEGADEVATLAIRTGAADAGRSGMMALANEWKGRADDAGRLARAVLAAAKGENP